MLDLLKRVIETSKNQPNMDFVEVELSGVEPPVSIHLPSDYREFEVSYKRPNKRISEVFTFI